MLSTHPPRTHANKRETIRCIYIAGINKKKKKGLGLCLKIYCQFLFFLLKPYILFVFRKIYVLFYHFSLCGCGLESPKDLTPLPSASSVTYIVLFDWGGGGGMKPFIAFGKIPKIHGSEFHFSNFRLVFSRLVCPVI